MTTVIIICKEDGGRGEGVTSKEKVARNLVASFYVECLISDATSFLGNKLF